MACYFAQRTINWLITKVSNFLKTLYCMYNNPCNLSVKHITCKYERNSKIILKPEKQGEKLGWKSNGSRKQVITNSEKLPFTNYLLANVLPKWKILLKDGCIYSLRVRRNSEARIFKSFSIFLMRP